jgi:RND family efflux transporter MFP subunit
MKLIRILLVAILLIAAGGGGYYAWTNVIHVQTVTTAIATQAPVSEAIYGTGTVEPARWAKVVPLQRRRLVDLCICEGQQVKAGQALGRMDDAEERSALNELQISFQQAQRDLDRAEKDRTKNDLTQKEYEERWTQVEEYKSRMAAQQVRIDQLVLRAPLDGMVLRRDGEVGEIAGPTDVLFWVGPPLPMHVVAEVNEEEINRLVVGQKAFLRSEAFPGQALHASVSQITPKGDPTRKTFRIYLLLPNDTPLRIGMSVEANIIVREKPAAIVVPAEAVAGDMVQIVSDGRIARVPVKVGIRGSRNVEVIGDVAKGTAVLSPVRTDLAEGTRVREDKSAVRPAATADATQEQPLDQLDRNAAGPLPAPAATAPAMASADPDTAVISSAISAHIDSVVNDARRNVNKFAAPR